MDRHAAITTQELVKSFHSAGKVVTAINHLNLTVQPGETFGLIGPDGAGKSTTIRVILGLLGRTAGMSTILGLDPLHDPFEVRAKAGYIAQQFALPADLTVLENLRFFADIHGIHSNDQKKNIPALLNFAGLEKFSARLAGKLSGGMKKKLALACSLIHEPEIVLLDEPTLGVDPISRREFWNLLGNLRAEKGLTIFVATPYMDEAERCNHIGLIYQGHLIASGSPIEIKQKVPGEVLEFIPVNFSAAQEACTRLDGVLEVQTYGASIHLFVDGLETRQRQIEAELTEHGIRWSGMRQIEMRMEEAFISLITRQEQGHV